MKQFPGWFDQRWLSPAYPAQTEVNLINSRLNKTSSSPLVSVVIPAWNEGANIIKCIDSLSRSQTSYPFEIIVVDNNSTDNTAEIIKSLNVRYVFMGVQGSGAAREAGQQAASGTYVLMGDADTFYPPTWIQIMTEALQQPSVICVYGRHSFFSHEKARWQFVLYEFLRDVMQEVRHLKRPHLNVLGMSMGYLRNAGLQIGFDMRNVRGEDGRMAFALAKSGKISCVRSRKARVWTHSRTLDKEGSLIHSVLARFALELSRMLNYFSRQEDHDAKTSRNENPSILRFFSRYRKAHGKD